MTGDLCDALFSQASVYSLQADDAITPGVAADFIHSCSKLTASHGKDRTDRAPEVSAHLHIVRRRRNMWPRPLIVMIFY
jgi:hypothetical protein